MGSTFDSATDKFVLTLPPYNKFYESVAPAALYSITQDTIISLITLTVGEETTVHAVSSGTVTNDSGWGVQTLVFGFATGEAALNTKITLWVEIINSVIRQELEGVTLKM